MANNRQCLCCGTRYEFCTSCSEHKGKPSWMFDYDTEECKDLFNAISGYNMGIFKESKVKAVLRKYNITDYSKYTESVQEVLKNIMTTTDAPKRGRKRKKKVDVDLENGQTSE